WAALTSNYRWVATRTRTELLRQWTFLTALLAPLTEDLANRSSIDLFRQKNEEIENEVVQSRLRSWWRRLLSIFGHGPSPNLTIEARVYTYWAKYRARCERMSQSRHIGQNDLALYLRRRPVRQLAWFRLAMTRLKRQAKSRVRWLAG